MIKTLKENKNCIIIAVILIIGFSTLIFMVNRQNQLLKRLIGATEEADMSIQKVDASITNLKDGMNTGNSEQIDIISDYTVVSREPNLSTLSATVDIEIVPRDFVEGTKAVFYIDDQKVELQAKENKYVGTVNLSILKSYTKASVSLIKSSMVRNATLALDISYVKYFTEQSTVAFVGEKGYEQGEYSYEGNIVYNHMLTAFDSILSSKLVRLVNGEVQWSKELPITNDKGEQQFILQQSFPLEVNSSFELYVEQKSKSGFTYRYYIDGGTVMDEDVFEPMEKEVHCEVFDKDGKSLTEK